MLTTDDAYTLLKTHVCPALDDVLLAPSLTQDERCTIRRALEMLEETLADAQEREAQVPCACGAHP